VSTTLIERLLTLECVLLRQRQIGEADEYGDPTWQVIDEEPLPCELQQEQAYEAEGGAVQVTTWRLFLPASAPPAGWDAVSVRVPDPEEPEEPDVEERALDGDVYLLEGDAWLVRNPRTGVEHHVEARVRRIR
jgi:hypothetical protein